MEKKYLQGDKEGMKDDLALLNASDSEDQQITEVRNGIKRAKVPFEKQVECTTNKFIDNKELRNSLKTMAFLAKSLPLELKDKFIHLFFPEDDLWYRGYISKFDQGSKKFEILYDENKSEVVNLNQEKFIQDEV